MSGISKYRLLCEEIVRPMIECGAIQKSQLNKKIVKTMIYRLQVISFEDACASARKTKYLFDKLENMHNPIGFFMSSLRFKASEAIKKKEQHDSAI